jgi:uncharacterized membrane protein (DUF485 family)
MAPPPGDDGLPSIERHALGPWLRVLVGLTGLLIAGAVGLLIVRTAPWGALHADDVGLLTVLAACGAIGLFFLFVSLVGHTPRWLPVSAPISWRDVRGGLLFMVAILVIDVVETAIRTGFGMPRVASTIITCVLLAGPYVALRSYIDRAKGARTSGPRPDT